MQIRHGKPIKNYVKTDGLILLQAAPRQLSCRQCNEYANEEAEQNN